MIYTNHGYFPSYFKRFNLRRINCFCGAEVADNEHYIQNCLATLHITYQSFIESTDTYRDRIFYELGKHLEHKFKTIPASSIP